MGQARRARGRAEGVFQRRPSRRRPGGARALTKRGKAGLFRILGVDPGTRRVGYGIVDMPTPSRFQYVECGVIKAPRGSDLPSRIHLLARTINEIIVELSPTVLAIEKAFHGINGASALRLGEARGAIMLVGVEQGLAVFEYAPAHVKRAVAGHGRASKADIQQRVAVLCGLRRPPDLDAADALAIAVCHGQHAVEAGSAPRRAASRRASG